MEEEYTIKLTRPQALAIMALFVDICIHRDRIGITDEEFDEISKIDLENLICMTDRD